ncbi:MAG TPA: putative porin [Terriglobales bacterium]|nr:putative porin [Terriglobales bacterium]
MRKFLTAIMTSVIISLALGMHMSYASEIDDLLQKLVEKGVLSASDAQEVRTATNDQIAKAEQQKQEDYKKLAKDNLPDWVKNTKLTGDSRLRYEYKQTKSNPVETNRERFRLRVSVENQVNDKVKAGFTLATGIYDNSASASASTRSNNQTFAGVFNKKPVIIDKAYMLWQPANWMSLIGGKFANPVWEPMDFMWDPDITPEGGAVMFKGSPDPQVNWFTNTGFFILDNSTSYKTNPFLFFIQPGFQWQARQDISIKAGAAYYGYEHVKGNAKLQGSTSTNTFVGGNYVNNYNALDLALDVGIDNPFDILGINFTSIKYLDLFGAFSHNVDVTDSADAWIAGTKFGAKNVAKFGDWQLRYAYKTLERDAILDVLPNDDFYGGKTGARGNEFFFELGLAKNTGLLLNYYHTWAFGENANPNPESHFMFDINCKF